MWGDGEDDDDEITVTCHHQHIGEEENLTYA